MKKHIMLISACAAALHVVSAANWEPPTRDCSLEFPGTDWTLKEGGAVNHGRMILAAVNREQTKSVTVIRFQVAPSMSVQDPGFVKGMKAGFTDAGSLLLTDGYTNVAGRIAYWFTWQKHVNEQLISTLNYSVHEGGALYQIAEESIGIPPLDDHELAAILASFRIHVNGTPAAGPMSRGDSVAYQIGRATGFLLIVILGFGVLAGLRRRRADKRSDATGK